MKKKNYVYPGKTDAYQYLSRYLSVMLAALISTAVNSQEISSIIPGVDRGYIAEDNSFIAMRRVQSLEFDALALTWSSNGLVLSDPFTMTNFQAGQYSAHIGEQSLAQFSRNENGQTYWALQDATGEALQNWDYGGLRGITNSSDVAAESVIRSWESGSDTLASLLEVTSFNEAFPTLLDNKTISGVIAPSPEAGYFVSYLESLGADPQVRTSFDFAGNNITAVSISPDQMSSLSRAAQGADGQITIDLSSRNFLVDGLKTLIVNTPSIFETFSEGEQVSKDVKVSFVQPFSGISPSSSCEVSKAASASHGAGILSCEYHSSEHRSGRNTWVLMFFQFTAHQIADSQLTITYLTTFSFHKGSIYNRPTTDEYRSEETYHMNREARLMRRFGLNAISEILSSL